ncbi:MAG: hypothetical protein H5T45_04100 [Thermoplasmatales archaeon]|nr:hypothetical protein [Thermoplasmatales archaeon]
MGYEIFEVTKENEKIFDELAKDDIVSRQSIWKRDAKSLGIEGNSIFIKIEGSEEAIKRAEEILKDKVKKIEGERKEEINKKFVEDEESASAGMGFIFG